MGKEELLAYMQAQVKMMQHMMGASKHQIGRNDSAINWIEENAASFHNQWMKKEHFKYSSHLGQKR